MYNWLHLVPDPEDIQKLPKTFLQIYETFQNSGNSFRVSKKLPDPEDLLKFRKAMILV
jgi:hypothetical protein